jgi:hypothetical protein
MPVGTISGQASNCVAGRVVCFDVVYSADRAPLFGRGAPVSMI